jgi:pyruvate,water dikinase
MRRSLIRWYEDLRARDVPIVGGKNASLGEMVQSLTGAGISVPGGFATTSQAYWAYVDANELRGPVGALLADLSAGRKSLEGAGAAIRKLFLDAKMPDALAGELCAAYRELSRREDVEAVDVAVRSSATAEDLPDASFAGQQESFLNVRGEPALLDACRRCYASLFTNRAIAYREQNGFDHMRVALSIGVQTMVRSDLAGAGVMFSIDTESGFPRVVVINAAWGLGESVVQGIVTPDEYTVFKPLLAEAKLSPIVEKALGTKEAKIVYARGMARPIKQIATSRRERHAFVLGDDEILQLARWACAIEEHYKRPMDIEWAKDGRSGRIYIVQARPETVQSRRGASSLKTYHLLDEARPLVTGLSIGEAIATGNVRHVSDPRDAARFRDGDVLVTEMTNPDWVPVMKRAAAIVTDQGGRTCHAAIVSREFGIPAVVGTGDGTRVLTDGRPVTVSCAEGETGHVYEGALKFEEVDVDLEHMPKTRTQIMMNLADPDSAFHWWHLPAEGVGLARMEFIINNIIKVHPMALVRFDDLKDAGARKEIRRLTEGYPRKEDYFVEQLARGIARLAAAQHPHEVIVRMSDFKTNEYANLIGGSQFEPVEDNPMLGFRGASRYYSDRYRKGFDLECQAIRRARDEMGFTNVVIMIPFCRTLEEADRVIAVLAENGLKRGENGLRLYVMCEIPSNVVLAEEFAQRFDGFSIGSNDLTQLVLGVDRDSADLAELFDERNEAVLRMIRQVIASAHRVGAKVGICGQAPSDYPEFAAFLVEAGIDSISLNPDSVVRVKRRVAEVERRAKRGLRAV